MKTKLLNIFLWMLPDSLVLAITMHGLRNNKLHMVAPFVMKLMAEIGLNTPDSELTVMIAKMDLMGKRYGVCLKCTWEEVEPKTDTFDK